MEPTTNEKEIADTYKAALKDSRGDGKPFNATKAATVALATLKKVKTEKGEYVTLSQQHEDITTAIIAPTTEIRIKAIEAVIQHAGAKLDDTVKALLRPLFNPAAVQKKLEAAAKPSRINWKDLIG